jgi:hypothetical protein
MAARQMTFINPENGDKGKMSGKFLNYLETFKSFSRSIFSLREILKLIFDFALFMSKRFANVKKYTQHSRAASAFVSTKKKNHFFTSMNDSEEEFSSYDDEIYCRCYFTRMIEECGELLWKMII